MAPFTLSWMLADWAEEAACDESEGAQPIGPVYARIGDERPPCDGG